MNTDIRISLDFPTHRKTLKLVRRLGDNAPWMLVRLWIYVARHLPEGVLTGMDEEDIEIAAGWSGENGAFVRALVDVGYLDRDADGVLSCHDWLEHNPWVADAEGRSDHARMKKLAQICPELYRELRASKIAGLSKMDYETVKQAYRNHQCLDDIRGRLEGFVAGQPTASQQLADGQPIVSQQLAPSPSPSPSPSPKSKEESSSPPVEETPPVSPPVSSDLVMTTRMFTDEFRVLYSEHIGGLMPGGLLHRAGELCLTHSRQELVEAFERTSLHGGRSFRYLEQVLSGARSRDAPQRRRVGESTIAERNRRILAEMGGKEAAVDAGYG